MVVDERALDAIARFSDHRLWQSDDGEARQRRWPNGGDRETALEEARYFSFAPGQAITYQIGKTQILKFLSDAKITQGEEFSLREFHDYLMLNGNVPIALLRWEYLGLDDEVSTLQAGR